LRASYRRTIRCRAWTAARRRWQLSKECGDATADASRAFCKGYFELKAEAALAGEARRHEERIASLKVQARQLEEQGAGREADSQAAVLASILGLQTAQVERGLMLFLAVLVEAGAALGLYFATGHMRLEGPARGARGREATAVSHCRRGRGAQSLLSRRASRPNETDCGYGPAPGAETETGLDVRRPGPARKQEVFHGLRKSAAVFLLEAGCADAEVSAITGQSRAMVAHYARQVNRKKLAAAVLKWQAAGETGRMKNE